MQSGCVPGDVSYTDTVCITCYVPYDIKGFKERIIDVTNGKVTVEMQNEGRFVDVN